MCDFASAFINPATFDVRVHDVLSHENTAIELGLEDGPKPNGWREMHYRPDGEIECRCLEVDKHTSDVCVDVVRQKWPTFSDFIEWAARNGAVGLRVLKRKRREPTRITDGDIVVVVSGKPEIELYEGDVWVLGGDPSITQYGGEILV